MKVKDIATGNIWTVTGDKVTVYRRGDSKAIQSTMSPSDVDAMITDGLVTVLN